MEPMNQTMTAPKPPPPPPPPPPPETQAQPKVSDSLFQFTVETAPKIAGNCTPCEAARRAQEAALIQAKQESKKTLGLISMLTAKAGKLVPDTLRKMRLAICHTCPESETGTNVKLFRRIDGNEYCGLPRLADITKIYRDETQTGCGCDLADKTRYELSQCPRGRWGPGPLMGPQYTVQIQPIRVLKDVLDVQVHYAIKPNTEMDMTGIGDTIAALPVIHAIARKFPSKRVRVRVVPNRVEWAKVGWPDVVSSDDLSTAGEWFLRLFTHRLIALDEEWAKNPKHKTLYTRHHGMCDAAGVSEPVRDIGLSPTKEAAEWGKGQFIGKDIQGKPVVCLSPFSTSNQRNWPLHHWVDLADHLTKAGVFVYFVDGPHPDRTKFLPYLRYWGWGPEFLVALFQKTDLVIGNDSAMAHLGGVMRRPTIAVCSASPGVVVFGWYDTVRVVQAEAACTACNWFSSRGYRNACDDSCEAMWDLKPSVVLGHALDILKGAKP